MREVEYDAKEDLRRLMDRADRTHAELLGDLKDRYERMSENEKRNYDKNMKKVAEYIDSKKDQHGRLSESDKQKFAKTIKEIEEWKELKGMNKSEPTNGNVKKFTEAAGELIEGIKSGSDIMGSQVSECPTVEPNSATEDKLISELQRIYNPVLVSQELNKGTTDAVLESVTADNVFNENNVIKFDDDTRKAQLISLCALLLARDANSPDYLAFKQAAKAKQALKLKIQNDYNAAAADLADRYLHSVAATSNSPIAKDAAENLANVQ